MGRWADKNNDKIADAILGLNKNQDKALKDLAKLADEAAKHDRADEKVMRQIIENHR